MPQIIEVLRYIHEVAESDELLTVEDEKDFENHEIKFLNLISNIKPAVSDILRELKGMRGIEQLSYRINSLERFLTEFQKLIEFPKLVRIKGKEQGPRPFEHE
jgi:hypothetical protein